MITFSLSLLIFKRQNIVTFAAAVTGKTKWAVTLAAVPVRILDRRHQSAAAADRHQAFARQTIKKPILEQSRGLPTFSYPISGRRLTSGA